uniref:Endonuclease-reverse transcriptase n=1 Tax=Cacopsylla melanoneura TaxID=428564 RepID=A0A8D8XQX4_9HEMI
MIVHKKPQPTPNIKAYGQTLERTENIVYLGCNLNQNWEVSKEIKIRIEKARATFINMRQLFCNRGINIPLKARLVRCYIFSVLLYGVESWTLTETLMKKLEAFEMWVYRRILRISWVDKVSNERVIQRMNKEKEIVNTIKTRKLQYLGHISRNPERYKIPLLLLKGKVEGRRGRGRKRTSWLQNLRQWYGKNNSFLFMAATNKAEIANLISHVR